MDNFNYLFYLCMCAERVILISLSWFSFLVAKQQTENATETATTKKLKKICGYYGPQHTKLCPQPRSLKCSRDLVTTHPWQLPPNRYNVLDVPFKRLQGAFGASWAKVHKHKGLPPVKGSKQQWKFYELGREMERMHKRCNQMKGIFITSKFFFFETKLLPTQY